MKMNLVGYLNSVTSIAKCECDANSISAKRMRLNFIKQFGNFFVTLQLGVVSGIARKILGDGSFEG